MNKKTIEELQTEITAVNAAYLRLNTEYHEVIAAFLAAAPEPYRNWEREKFRQREEEENKRRAEVLANMKP